MIYTKEPLGWYMMHCTKMKFSIKRFFSKCDQIRRKLRIWSHLLKKFLTENFIFCAVDYTCPPLGGWLYQLIFKQWYLKNRESKQYFHQHVFEEYLISFLLIPRLIDFADVALQLLMFKVYRNFGTSKLNCPIVLEVKVKQRIKQNYKQIKTIRILSIKYQNYVQNTFNKNWTFL